MLELSPGEFLLVKLRTPKHFYGPDAQAIAGPEGEGYLRVIPAMLRDQVTYLRHYSSMACHAAPEQMWAGMQRADYWFAGGVKYQILQTHLPLRPQVFPLQASPSSPPRPSVLPPFPPLWRLCFLGLPIVSSVWERREVRKWYDCMLRLPRRTRWLDRSSPPT